MLLLRLLSSGFYFLLNHKEVLPSSLCRFSFALFKSMRTAPGVLFSWAAISVVVLPSSYIPTAANCSELSIVIAACNASTRSFWTAWLLGLGSSPAIMELIWLSHGSLDIRGSYAIAVEGIR